MPVVVKWVDLKGAGVSRYTWAEVKRRLKPVDGTKRLFVAWQVEEMLGLERGSLVLRKRAVR